MAASIVNLENNKDKETITKVVLEITKRINVNHIYLIPGEEESTCPYSLILIIEDMAKRFKQRLKETLAEMLQAYPMFAAHFFTLHYIQNCTSEGNTFFLNHCTEERLIYYTTPIMKNGFSIRWT